MQNALNYLNKVVDIRQEKKVQHRMKDIIAIVFFAMLANASEWMEIYFFAITHESFLRKYLELPNGIPSHDTIQGVFSMVSAEFLEGFQRRWNRMLSTNEGEKVEKILALDEDGFCLGQKLVQEKSNEITAVPDLLDTLNVKGHIITTDAMVHKRISSKKSVKKGGLCTSTQRQPRYSL